MTKLYVIQWKSKVNGRAGRGTKTFEFEEGEQLVHELNHEYPDIHHELAPAGSPPGPSIPENSAATTQEETAASAEPQVEHELQNS